MIEHDATELLVARVDGRVVGMATLVSFPLPTGIRGFVEDVVTDSTVRGRGIGRTLLTAITDLATQRQFRSLELTSRPTREAAIRLYESAGFSRRETNVMRFTPTVAADITPRMRNGIPTWESAPGHVITDRMVADALDDD